MADKGAQPQRAESESAVVEVDHVQLLTEVCSNSFRISNTTWLALVTVSAVVIAPRDPGAAITIPWGVGTVTPASFYVVTLVMLIAATLAFAGAHAQAYRAYDLAMKEVSSVGLHAVVRGTSIHPSDLLDLLLHPTINRVGPIAQLARGRRHQFRRELHQIPVWRTRMVDGWYVVLKLTAFGFYFGIPSYALGVAFWAAPLDGWARAVATGGVLVSSLSLGQIMLREFFQIGRVTAVHLGATSGGA